MLSKHGKEGRNQLELIALEDLIPIDRLVRKIEASMNFDFVYDWIEDHYCWTMGDRALIQYLFGIRLMRKTIKEIETNLAYRWFF
jgi:transposase